MKSSMMETEDTSHNADSQRTHGPRHLLNSQKPHRHVDAVEAHLVDSEESSHQAVVDQARHQVVAMVESLE